MSDGVFSVLVGIAALLVIVCSLLFINDHITCTNMGGLIKGACAFK